MSPQLERLVDMVRDDLMRARDRVRVGRGLLVIDGRTGYHLDGSRIMRSDGRFKAPILSGVADFRSAYDPLVTGHLVIRVEMASGESVAAYNFLRDQLKKEEK